MGGDAGRDPMSARSRSSHGRTVTRKLGFVTAVTSRPPSRRSRNPISDVSADKGNCCQTTCPGFATHH